jgi:hypothetical protein
MWFKIAQLISWFIMPIILVIIGWKIKKWLKEIEYSQWGNQKLIEKKLKLFDEIMPRLNELYCFYLFVGNWKEISPDDIIKNKRYLDSKMFIYAAILGKKLVSAYEKFIKISFETYVSEGSNAKIRTIISGFDGDRRIHCNYNWEDKWDLFFSSPETFNKIIFQESYDAVVREFQRSIGIIYKDN